MRKNFQPARRSMSAALILLVPGLLAGCVSTAPGPEDWTREIPALVTETERSPEDPEAWTRLGVAYELAGKDAESVEALERAIALEPESPAAGLPLVRLHLDGGRLDRAQEILGGLRPRQEDDSELLRSAELRLERERLVLRMRELASEEARLGGRELSGESIGVLDFPVTASSEQSDSDGTAVEGAGEVDGTPAGAGERTDSRVNGYKGLGKALSAVVTTELSRLPDLRVLERQNLQILMGEIQLMESQQTRKPEPPPLDAVDTVRGIQQRLSVLRPSPQAPPFYGATIDGLPGPGTTRAIQDFQATRGLTADGIPGPRTQRALQDAVDELYENPSLSPEREPALQSGPRAGRLLGARRLLGGEIRVVADRDIAVRSRVVDSLDGALLSEADIDVPLAEFHRVPGRIVLAAANDLEIPLDEETRRRFQDLPPVTRSLAAFLAFGRGLEYEDRGLWREASSEYETALRLAPEFDLARERVEVVRFGSASFEQSIQRAVRGVTQAARASSRAAEEALGAVGTGTQEGDRRDDSTDGSRAVQSDGPPTGTVRVAGQIPVGR